MSISLEINDLRAGYGKRAILDGLSTMPIDGGHLTGVLGPNASGKSTLIKTLAGINRVRGGSVELSVDGQGVQGKELRAHMGYVPQELPSSASITAFEAVLIAARRTRATSPEHVAADTMGAMGIGGFAGTNLAELSGGQRQLVAVAQMLVGDPSVMLLDEPTSALDLNRQIFLLDLVRERVRFSGAVALVAIHDINLATRFCEELVVMKQGRVIAQGTPREVICPELLDSVYGINARILEDDGVPVVLPC
ncbi:ABC transporter ATP-binding protein [Corynebacterium sp. H127]|uniref:ABC transporter ATP-binding protein n=1 Tax=Corynebacterium sp. H127 TaxID=3133418 RepID=UPI00309BD756